MMTVQAMAREEPCVRAEGRRVRDSVRISKPSVARKWVCADQATRRGGCELSAAGVARRRHHARIEVHHHGCHVAWLLLDTPLHEPFHGHLHERLQPMLSMGQEQIPRPAGLACGPPQRTGALKQVEAVEMHAQFGREATLSSWKSNGERAGTRTQDSLIKS
jgi:hypothetical protein